MIKNKSAAEKPACFGGAPRESAADHRTDKKSDKGLIEIKEKKERNRNRSTKKERRAAEPAKKAEMSAAPDSLAARAPAAPDSLAARAPAAPEGLAARVRVPLAAFLCGMLLWNEAVLRLATASRFFGIGLLYAALFAVPAAALLWLLCTC
ncbi:MAG: hypothetical protein RSA17_03470, partial [Ruthenibacterium sp.]